MPLSQIMEQVVALLAQRSHVGLGSVGVISVDVVDMSTIFPVSLAASSATAVGLVEGIDSALSIEMSSLLFANKSSIFFPAGFFPAFSISLGGFSLSVETVSTAGKTLKGGIWTVSTNPSGSFSRSLLSSDVACHLFTAGKTPWPISSWIFSTPPTEASSSTARVDDSVLVNSQPSSSFPIGSSFDVDGQDYSIVGMWALRHCMDVTTPLALCQHSFQERITGMFNSLTLGEVT